jgi:4-diphosphocytidyl-2-C-methyl-D-erythritol kinase
VSTQASVAAPAKVNLWLHVLGQRPDGYHDLDTLFQAIDLADDVAVDLVGGDGVALEVHGPDLGPAADNLAYRAAELGRRALGLDAAVRVRLSKRIAVGAGLGGGSSDAAAVLACLAALAGVARDDPRVFRAAAALGSDVAFFLGGSPLARGTGRGEVLEPVPPLPAADLVLVSPPAHVSSGAAYRALAEARRERPGRTSAALATRATAARSRSPATWEDVAAAAHNDFEPVITARHPEIPRSLAALREAGARPALMSGSGSTSFGLFQDRAAAERAAAQMERDLGWPCRAVRTLTELPVPRVT